MLNANGGKAGNQTCRLRQTDVSFVYQTVVSNTQFEVRYDRCDTCCECIISFGVKYPSTLKTFTHKQHHNTFSINQILTIKKCVMSLSILHTRIQRKGVVMSFFFFLGGGVQARFIHKRPTLFWSTSTHTHTQLQLVARSHDSLFTLIQLYALYAHSHTLMHFRAKDILVK